MKSFVIGRPGSGAEVELDNEYVSTLHCRVVITDEGDVMVEDLESTNDTYVRTGSAVSPVYPGRLAPIKPGDVLMLSLRFDLPWNPVPCLACGRPAMWLPTKGTDIGSWLHMGILGVVPDHEVLR